jgi:hypothetical protein
MATIFQSHFFNLLHDDTSPPTLICSRNLPTRALAQISEEEIGAYLCPTSLNPAPGPSGIRYLLVRWAFEACPTTFSLIFNHALSLGKHPWGDATIIIIPKPGKMDYTVAKVYCLISLLECCRKLLEKVVAARLGWEVDHTSLIGDCQFSSRHHYSAPDATLCLAYKARETI